MLLVVPDAGLSELLTSSVLLLQIWPAAVLDVQMLITVLRMSVPSLSEALATGMVTLMSPVNGGAFNLLVLESRGVRLLALAQTEDGEAVRAPHEHLATVTRLEVFDVQAEGLSALRLAG